MGMKKWIQKKVCNALWAVMTHMEKDVVMEFTIDMEKQTDEAIHKYSYQEGKEIEGMYHAPAQVHDHECGCLTAEKLRNVEQEWIERGIIR